MRILLLSHFYSPNRTPRAFRWGSIATVWAACGHHVDVIASPCPGAPDEEQLEGVQVYRPGNQWSARLRQRWGTTPGKHPEEKPAEAVSAPPRRNLIKALLQTTYHRTWKQLWWPDWAALWYFPAAACAERLLAERSYDAMVSSSHPFTDHLVALRLKRRWPQLRWLVDIGDPFCFADDMPLNNFRLYRRRNQRMEQIVFETADRVAVTNERTKQRYEEVFGPDACRNVHVIGPAIPASFLEAPAFAEDSPFPPDSVNVVFTGNLINPVRRPQELMSWMDKVARRWAESYQRKLVFHLFGDSIEGLRTVAQAAGVHNGNVQCHGSVPRPKAAAALHAAQFVLNCGNVTDYQLPSKVYEYMATGKPIINVVFNRQDPSIAALKPYPHVIHCEAQADPDDVLIRFLAEHRTTTLAPAAVVPLVQSHLVPQIAAAYEALLT